MSVKNKWSRFVGTNIHNSFYELYRYRNKTEIQVIKIWRNDNHER